MARRRKADVADEVFLEAIAWLENGGTKKGACEILGVSNNKTMESMISEWQTKKETDARLRREKRRQAVTPLERANIIGDYLDGSPLGELSDRYYRSTAKIKDMLFKAGAMIREQGTVDTLNPPMLPEECIAETFRVRTRYDFEAPTMAAFETFRNKLMAELDITARQIVEVKSPGKWGEKCAIDVKGEIVWSPAHQCLAEVVKEVPSKFGTAYRIYLLDPDRHSYACVLSEELGSLEHLRELGVDVDSRGLYLSGVACVEQLNAALLAARKNKEK